ncbi:3'-5' exonuclease [Kribbella solani]|uniref:UvrD-like helicase C-terminal domain-containing protein n=1 Tax=Kribbella solani TaxID=236067 RepID=A0A841DMI1_9ACTN|nr:3'-5' exonuclease [Kribbella solani]MBB5979873.1 hypothetical protein [Kribbella solani]
MPRQLADREDVIIPAGAIAKTSAGELDIPTEARPGTWGAMRQVCSCLPPCQVQAVTLIPDQNQRGVPHQKALDALFPKSDISLQLLPGPAELVGRLDSFRIRLTEVVERVDSWDQVADTFTDAAAVPLLTVHRSKGLEYHTVFLVGMDDDQWWAHARDTIGSTMAFFVGVSRAAERLIFTQCDARGSNNRIADLYQILNEAGVELLRFE